MTGFNKEKRIAALCVALLLLEFSLTPIFISMVQQDAQNTGYASATAQTQAYQAASTSTALAWATANASLIAANPNPYSSGTLALYDSLSHSLDWYNYTDTSFGGTCQFTKGAFHVIQSRPQRFYYCTEYRDFSNFTFEVQMTIAQGDCGGIVFRVEPGVQLYYFGICQNGHYYLTLHVDNTAIHIRHLKGKFTSAIKTGLHVSNVIAVVAKGSQLSLFVNKQNIANVTDSTYSHGTLGLSADDDNHPTDVIFQNAKLWQS